MAHLTDADILKLASLSMLKLTDNEVRQFKVEFNHILSYVEQLQKVDIGDLQPTSQVTGLTNVMRPDELIDYSETSEKLLAGSKVSNHNHIQVKKIL